jgi:hypothetical protein
MMISQSFKHIHHSCLKIDIDLDSKLKFNFTQFIMKTKQISQQQKSSNFHLESDCLNTNWSQNTPLHSLYGYWLCTHIVHFNCDVLIPFSLIDNMLSSHAFHIQIKHVARCRHLTYAHMPTTHSLKQNYTYKLHRSMRVLTSRSTLTPYIGSDSIL